MQPVDLGDHFNGADFTPMGVAAGDFDGDGAMDYLMTTASGAPELFAGARGHLPKHRGNAPGLAAQRTAPGSPATSWSALARDRG